MVRHQHTNFPKNCMKLRKFWSVGELPRRPLGSVTGLMNASVVLFWTRSVTFPVSCSHLNFVPILNNYHWHLSNESFNSSEFAVPDNKFCRQVWKCHSVYRQIFSLYRPTKVVSPRFQFWVESSAFQILIFSCENNKRHIVQSTNNPCLFSCQFSIKS